MPSKNESTTQHQKIRIFNIPITNIEPTAIGDVVDRYISAEDPSQIVFLSWWGLIRAICKWDHKAVVRKAAIVIPTSRLIALGAFVLRGERLHCYSDFDFIIKVLSRIELQGKSIYLLGMEMGHIQAIEQNIRNTFPKLMVVGRYSGYFSSVQEQKIVTAIRKTNTTLLLAGNGVPNKEIWLYRVKHKIKPCIMIWSGMTMDILAGRMRKPPNGKIRRLVYVIRQIVSRPWRIYRFFVFLFYFFALFHARIFRR